MSDSARGEGSGAGKSMKLHFDNEAMKRAIATDPDDASYDAGVLHPEAPRPRFFIEHGVIHDRKTGKHVRGCDCVLLDGSAAETCALLNELAAPHPTGSDGLVELAKEATGWANDAESWAQAAHDQRKHDDGHAFMELGGWLNACAALLRSAADRIAHSHDNAMRHLDIVRSRSVIAPEEYKALQSRMGILEKALEPFAKAWDVYRDTDSVLSVGAGRGDYQIDAAAFRAAREARGNN